MKTRSLLVDLISLLILLGVATGHYQLQQAPRITEHPVDTVVARHDPATLNCHAAGEPEPRISWFKDGAPLRSAPHRVLLPAGGLFFLKVVHGRKESDQGVYWCEAFNAMGKARSRNASLTVAVLREDFRLSPQSARVSAGEDVVLECAPPRGSPEPVVQWRRDGQALQVQDRYRLVDGYNLAIAAARPEDDGRYQCVARNMAGIRESSVAVLKVYVKPYLLTPPRDTSTLVGSSVELACGVGGDPMPDVLWTRNSPGGTMPLGRVRVLEDRSLRIERVTLLDQGSYSCEADNYAGSVSASATLTVHAIPTFSTRPLAQTVEAGQEVSFHCNASGSPKPFIFWSFEGDRALIYPGVTQGNFEAFTSVDGHSTLVLKNAQVQNSGTVIICSAVNEAGSISTRTRLTVTSREDRPPPVIIRGPVNQTLPIGSVAFLNCEASGSPKPVISWYKDDVAVTSSSRINMSDPDIIEIYHLEKEDSGAYTCVASSKGGKATWTGHLLVENPKNPNINFFKAPESIMLPGPPSRPHALNQSEGSVTITWGQNNKIGSSSLLGYQIELFGREEGVIPTWTVVATKVPGPMYTQHLLSPGVPYTFLVRAENAHGLGPPSQLSEPVIVGPDSTQNWGNPEVTILSEARASLVSVNIVKLIEVLPVVSTAVKLIWEIIDSQYVEGLYIYYICLDGDPDLPKTYNMLTVLHTGGSSTFTVNNLEKWSRYQFFLVPFFKTVEGQPSNSRIVRTLEDVPVEPPINMEALLLNSSAVYLKWKPPPTNSLNGILQGYKVELRNNASDDLNSINVGNTPTLLLGNLTAGVSYTVRVAAYNGVGMGPFSTAAVLRLDPTTKIADSHHQTPLTPTHSGSAFVTETWFMALLISMVSVMAVLFAAMLLMRRRALLAKKAPGTPRSNGPVLAGPLSAKHDPPLWMDKDGLTEYSPGCDKVSNGGLKYGNGVVNVQGNPVCGKLYARPDRLDYGSEKSYGRKFGEYGSMQVQDYASPTLGPDSCRGSQIADYAEVDANAATMNGGAISPAPYATTTLVTRGRRIGNSMIWTPQRTPSPSDDPPYPAANGGYYNRKVYSDSYFSPTQTLRRPKKEARREERPPDLVSPSQPVYARVGPPGLSWRNGAPPMSSFHKQVYHASTKSEPGGNML